MKGSVMLVVKANNNIINNRDKGEKKEILYKQQKVNKCLHFYAFFVNVKES